MYIYRRYLINALLLYIEFLCVLLIMISSSNRFLANNEDLDPDSNYYNELALLDATYLSADEVFNVTKSTQLGFSIALSEY